MLLGNWLSWGLHFPRYVKGSDVDLRICLNTLFRSSSKMTCSKLFFYVLYLANSNAKHQFNPLHKKNIIFALWLHVSKCTFWFTFSQHVSSKNKLHKITARILKMHNNNLRLIKNFQTILNYHCLPYITGPKFPVPFFIFPFPTIYCHLTIILDRCVSA